MTMTLDELKSAVPKHLQSAATPELLDTLNQLAVDYDTAEVIRENFICYTKVLQEGKFKLQDYLNAVQYVTYKHMKYSNKDAYAKTFPQRYQALVLKGATEKDISAYVSAYSSGMLVNKVMQQSLISPWILNQDLFQKALNVQADLMMTASSEKVRTEAANSLLTHLKPPEIKKVELALDVKQDAGIADLRASLQALAAGQIRQIEGGQTAKMVSRIPVVQVHQPAIEDAEFVEVPR